MPEDTRSLPNRILTGAEGSPLGLDSESWVGKSTAARWSPLDDSVSVAGRDILAMIYVGAELPVTHVPMYCTLRPPKGNKFYPWIDPSLPVSPPSEHHVHHFAHNFLLSYAKMSRQQRGSFLDWLERGATIWTGDNVGFFLLYFWGLEYRFFMGPTDVEERSLIISEVERLLDDCNRNCDCVRPMGKFLELAYAVVNRFAEQDPLDHPGIMIPGEDHLGVRTLSARCGLGRRVANGQALDADCLLIWMACYRHSIPWRLRSKQELKKSLELFRMLFDAKYPDGIRLRGRTRPKVGYRYIADSRLFVCTAQQILGNLPSPRTSKALLTAAETLSEQVAKALKPYEKFVLSYPYLSGSLEAHLLLPKPLRPLYPCASFEGLDQWLEAIADQGLNHDRTLADLTVRVLGKHARNASKEQLTRASTVLRSFGMGMVPDPEYSLRRIHLYQPVIVFRLAKERRRISTYKVRYESALIALHAAMCVATSGASMTPPAWNAINKFINGVTPGPGEQQRLRAEAVWLAKFRPTLRLVRSALSLSRSYTGRRVREAMASVVAATGIASREQFKALVAMYSFLGLSREDIVTELVNLDRGRYSQEQHVAKMQPRNMRLDAGRVAVVQQDTNQVRHMLQPILAGEDMATSETPARLPGVGVVQLDAAHQAFLRVLLTRPNWDDHSATHLAKRFKLMLDGAIELLNEWSNTRFDDLLVEEDGGYELNPAVVRQLKAEAEG